MNKININDINFQKLMLLNAHGSTSSIYTDGNICYKLLNKLYNSEKQEIYNKFLAMQEIKLENVALPIDFIMEDDKLVGYTMKYQKNSKSFFDKYLNPYFNCKELFSDIYNASIILRKIHEQKIIYQDLNFDNILVDENKNILFCDIDSCVFLQYESDFHPYIVARFLSKYRNSYVTKKEDIDKLSMILHLLYVIYNREIQYITQEKYNSLSEKIETLKNLKKWFNMLINKNVKIIDLPYLDEIINLQDDYIIDKKII